MSLCRFLYAKRLDKLKTSLNNFQLGDGYLNFRTNKSSHLKRRFREFEQINPDSSRHYSWQHCSGSSAFLQNGITSLNRLVIITIIFNNWIQVTKNFEMIFSFRAKFKIQYTYEFVWFLRQALKCTQNKRCCKFLTVTHTHPHSVRMIAN